MATQKILSFLAIPISVLPQIKFRKNKMFRKDYTDEDVIRVASEVVNCSELLRRLGLQPKGGNYYTMKKKLASLNIDCSHWSGQGWSKDKKLKGWSEYTTTGSFKRHLLKELGNICENCNLSTWLEADIPLDLHHIDGDRTNNSLENLQLLCPNCHALTDNFKGKNIKPVISVKKKREVEIKPITAIIRRTKIVWPDKIQLKGMISVQSTRSVAKLLGVSDKSVRNQCKKYEIDLKADSPWSKRHGSKPNTIIPIN